MAIDTDEAYLMGIIIGGGRFFDNNDSFEIILPYREWGNISKDPARAGEIGRAIISDLKPNLRNKFGLDLSYDVGKRDWTIKVSGNLTKLKERFSSFGITLYGDIKHTADLTGIYENLSLDPTKYLKGQFLAGLADSLGSVSPSQRRFSENTSIISFEFSGFNFQLICFICRMFADLNMFPDQVEWNHPNFQVKSDPYYEHWKKGFKVRVKLDDYLKYGKFGFAPKVTAAECERNKQAKPTDDSVPCSIRDLQSGISTLHPGEESNVLPEQIRGGHFICQKHICAVLGCPYAPVDKIKKALTHAEDFFTPFPVLHKDTYERILSIAKADSLLSKLDYTPLELTLKEVLRLYSEKRFYLFGSPNGDSGYHLGRILDGIAFCLASELSLPMNGKRIAGNRDILLNNQLTANPDLCVSFYLPSKPSVLLIKFGRFGAMIGTVDSKLNKKIYRLDEDGLKLRIRKPTFEDYD